MKKISYNMSLASHYLLDCDLCEVDGKWLRGVKVFEQHGIFEDDDPCFQACEDCSKKNGFIEKLHGCTRANHDAVVKYIKKSK